MNSTHNTTAHVHLQSLSQVNSVRYSQSHCREPQATGYLCGHLRDVQCRKLDVSRRIILINVQDIYNYTPETDHVSRTYSFAVILSVHLAVHVTLLPIWNVLYFKLVLSQIYVQCPIWLLSVFP